jgi:hypothetical protein
MAAQTIRLRARVGSHRTTARVPEAAVLRVVGTAWGPGKRVLWMRVVTSSGRAGWTSIKVTVPARKQRNAIRWQERHRGGGDRDDRRGDDRRKARPRPR